MSDFHHIQTNGPEGARLYTIRRERGRLVKVHTGAGKWWGISRNALASILRVARACPNTEIRRA